MDTKPEVLTQTILPFALHGINPRTIMGQYKWNKIKKEAQSIANHHCQACGRYVEHIPGDWLECHEEYNIDMKNHVFSIKNFICLCKECHNYIHQGRLRMLLLDGTIDEEYYNKIISHGESILKEHGLSKKDLPKDEIENPEWKLEYDGYLYFKET